MVGRRFPLVVAGVALLALNAVAIPVALAQRWAAGFGTTPDPSHIADQWAGTGTAISAPLAPLVALVVFLALVFLPWRLARIVGCAGCVLVGFVFVVGSLGEPTTFHPAAQLDEVFHVSGLVMAALLMVLASWNLAADLRRQRT